MRTESEKGSKVKPFIYHVRTETFDEAGVLVVGRIALPVRYLILLGVLVFGVVGAIFLSPSMVSGSESVDAAARGAVAVLERVLGVVTGAVVFGALAGLAVLVYGVHGDLRKASNEVHDR